MAKESKMDFNFDDIAGSKKEAPKPKAPKKQDGITLTIPTKDGYLSRDLTECTTDEFLDWARAVYPLLDEEKLNPSDFDRIDQRIRAMKQIEEFHTQILFAGKKDEKLAH